MTYSLFYTGFLSIAKIAARSRDTTLYQSVSNIRSTDTSALCLSHADAGGDNYS